MRALVLEPEAAARGRLTAALGARGHDAQACSSAGEAWEAYERERPALVLLNWTGAEGPDLCQRIRSAPTGRHCLILAMGLNDHGSHVESTLEVGADDYLPGVVDAAVLSGRLAVAERRANQIQERSQTEEDLRRLRKALETMRLGVTITDVGGFIQYVNPADAEMHGYQAEELVGRQARRLAPKPQWCELTSDTLRGAKKWIRERVQVRKDGSTFPTRLLSDVVTDASGRPVGMVTTCEDIGEMRRAEEALRESEERYALAVREMNDGLWDWNLRTGRVYFSPRWKAMLGYEEHEVGEDPADWLDRVHPEDLPRVKAKITASVEGQVPELEDEHRMRHKDGAYRWVQCRGFAVRDAECRPSRMAGVQTDITDRRTYDPLTSLPNRALFSERLRQALGGMRRQPGTLFAVLFVDLDRFKVVNDTFGHLAGDQVLVAVARRLESCLRPGDGVGRFGGDEFAVLLDPIKDVSDATRVADRIQKELMRPIEPVGLDVFVSASIGIALPSTGHERPDDVLRDADAAMYRAKAAGRARYEVFDETMRQRVLAQLGWESDLRRALMRRELRVYYQPIVSLATGRILGVEALSRWQHPQRGLVLPAEFVALAEETGLIVPLGERVLEEACERVRAWQGRFPLDPPLSLSVNISGRQFAERDFAERTEEILRRTSLAPDSLRLDISEGSIGGADSVLAILEKLRALGVHLHIDDFGTGSSSLGRLWDFPADTLKVDRSFVMHMNKDGGPTLVRTILALARGFGMSSIAEGVETARQAAQLRALRCEQGQGFFFAEPLEAADAERLLAAPPPWYRPDTRHAPASGARHHR